SMYAMFNDLAKGRKELLADPGKPISTLVPDVPGKYRDLMAAGEKAFKAGQYRQALASFKSAQESMQPQVPPGCTHALMQAVFALAKESYREPAGDLCKTLKDFPELPLVNFSPKDYYGRKEDYAKHLARLEARVKKNPKDADAQFLLAYLLWRDGDFDNAERAINLAIENASTKELKQAIDTLVQGVAKTHRSVKGELPKLQKPKDYPNAGLQLALPKGFEIKPLEKASQVLVASSEGEVEKNQTFTISIFPVSEGVSASQFVDGALADLRRQGTLGDIKQTSRVTFNIHGITGDGVRLDFSHKGKEVSAIAGCFIREVRSPDGPKDSAMIRLAYVVSLETARANKDSLPPAIHAIAKSIRFTDVRHPMDIPIAKGKELKDEEHGLAVVLPVGWVARKKSDGIAMGQIDFLLGGVASPMVHASAVDVPAGLDHKQCLQRLLKKYKDMGYTVELLSQGPAKLAGLDGYQFAIRRSVVGKAVKDPYVEKRPAAKPMTKPGPAYIEMGRFAFSPGSVGDKTGKKKVYFIDMVCYDDNVKKVSTVLDHLADGFTILKPAAGE
ncbi:MAG: tetratricopeptide repeat protein, partial [Phycisphaerae bacterium]|nr:tetratricopeptide repeat protein [Phycisphaerae bacterium]